MQSLPMAKRKFRTSTKLKRGIKKTVRKTRLTVEKRVAKLGKKIQPRKRIRKSRRHRRH